jgi:hypothetical protein
MRRRENKSVRRPASYVTAALLLTIAASVAGVFSTADAQRAKPRPVDPAAWGADHVGKPVPTYVTGDECLFCHRKIGSAWNENPHQLTIRSAGGGDDDDVVVATLRRLPAGKEAAGETRYLLGSTRVIRYLKRSKQYGKLEMLSTSFVPGKKDRGASKEPSALGKRGELKDTDSPHWDKKVFGDRCAGCHATAVDTKVRSFAATSLDCFVCHGDVDLKHTKDVRRVLLSSKSREPRQIVSICGQCHLRGGKSKSSGLPYPNTFIAGDNLFRDFRVDFSSAAIRALPAVDQHIFLNARDVAHFGHSGTTCITCHDVHAHSSEKHQQLDNSAICASCHVPGTDNSKLQDSLLVRNRHRTHSRVCDY